MAMKTTATTNRRWFSASPSPSSSTFEDTHFFDLPVEIRRRIYCSAGVPSGQYIDMNHYGRDPRPYENERYHKASLRHVPLMFAVELLTVCHTVHNEVLGILYGENYFEITNRLCDGLRPLEALSGAALGEIRFLLIRISMNSCIDSCCRPVDRRCGQAFRTDCERGGDRRHVHDALFKAGFPVDDKLILRWQRICDQLKRSIQPERLALYVICDCVDLRTAELIVEPLRSFPVFKDLGLRLARDYDQQMQGLARDTVLALTPRPDPLPPFRFLDLPREIQVQILEYATLVDRVVVKCLSLTVAAGGGCESEGEIGPRDKFQKPGRTMACFCSKGHSAFYSGCNCETRAFPLSPLLLVSRDFSQLAIKLLYKQNRFEVEMSSWIEGDGSDSSYPHVDTYMQRVFVPALHHFPHKSIQFLTWISLSFERCSRKYDDWGAEHSSIGFVLADEKRGWATWTKTINFLAEKVNLPGLTLELRFEEWYYLVYEEPEGAHQFQYDLDWEDLLIREYEKFIAPVATLKGLKRFFFHMTWLTGGWVRDTRSTIEQRLERLVMGDGYDAWKSGKTTNPIHPVTGRRRRALLPPGEIDLLSPDEIALLPELL